MDVESGRAGMVPAEEARRDSCRVGRGEQAIELGIAEASCLPQVSQGPNIARCVPKRRLQGLYVLAWWDDTGLRLGKHERPVDVRLQNTDLSRDQLELN